MKIVTSGVFEEITMSGYSETFFRCTLPDGTPSWIAAAKLPDGFQIHLETKYHDKENKSVLCQNSNPRPN
jgi:hypothetical protein